MKNEMMRVLNDETVSASFAETPTIDLASTEEELENGIIVWSHKVKFGKTVNAVEVRFIFEKSGSIYLDILQNV